MARDIDWITTDYNNQNAPTTFLTGYTTGIGAGNGEVTTNSTTSVDLLSLDATASCAGTTIAWQMAQGFDTLGFNVFRETNGARVKLNDGLVPGTGALGRRGRALFVRRPGAARIRTRLLGRERHLLAGQPVVRPRRAARGAGLRVDRGARFGPPGRSDRQPIRRRARGAGRERGRPARRLCGGRARAVAVRPPSRSRSWLWRWRGLRRRRRS